MSEPDPIIPIDLMPVAELAARMNDEDRQVPDAVRAAFDALVPAIEAAADRVAAGGRLIYVGAGTPGRLGVLDASEIPPTFGQDPDRVHGIIAGGPTALVDAVEGAEDDAEAGARAADDAGIGAVDTVIGLAASGRTPFVLGAVRRAGELGAVTIGVSCVADAELSAAVDHEVEVLVGAEVVRGSTRLKAGTAQKLVLNMFSTIAMVRSGTTYGDLMVDLRVTNAKLRARAEGIIRTLTGVDGRTARDALTSAGDRVPVAVVMLRRGLDASAAAAELARAHGRLRDALDGQ